MPSKYNLPTLRIKKAEEHNRAVYKFPTRGVMSNHPKDIFSCDLVDMSNKPSGGFRYILICVDVFSRKIFYKLLKSKTTAALITAFEAIFAKGDKPNRIWTDQESGIMSKEFKQHFPNLIIYNTFGNAKSSMAERAIRTIRELVEKINQHSDGWSSIIGEIVASYNTAEHSSTETEPNKAYKGQDNGMALYHNLVNFFDKRKNSSHTFAVGDRVRMVLKKGKFDKGYTARWSHEILTVAEVLKTNPMTYRLKDKTGEVLLGSFYAQELQKTRY